MDLCGFASCLGSGFPSLELFGLSGVLRCRFERSNLSHIAPGLSAASSDFQSCDFSLLNLLARDFVALPPGVLGFDSLPQCCSLACSGS